MFSLVRIPSRILAVLELNISPAEVAGGVCLGMFLGFTPLTGPMALLLFLFFFLLKINRFSTTLTLPLFKLLYVLGVAQLAERLGGYLLIDATCLTGFWRVVTNLPVVALLDLNNTRVAGGMAISLFLLVPVFLVSRFGYVRFIEKNLIKIQQSKFGQRLNKFRVASKVVQKMDIIRNKTE